MGSMKRGTEILWLNFLECLKFSWLRNREILNREHTVILVIFKTLSSSLLKVILKMKIHFLFMLNHFLSLVNFFHCGHDVYFRIRIILKIQ